MLPAPNSTHGRVDADAFAMGGRTPAVMARRTRLDETRFRQTACQSGPGTAPDTEPGDG